LVSAKISLSKLQEGLHTKRFGRRILFAREVSSTNEWVKELARFGAEEGTVAIAETQTAGHGRLNRAWFSPVGGLWFSVVLRPKLHVAEAAKVVFAAGLAVADVLREKYDLPVETKWPNDVLVKGRKICGILAEMSSKGKTVNFVAVGVGVNVNFDVAEILPTQIRECSISMRNALGRKVALEELFNAVLERLETLYESFVECGFASVLERWKEYAHFLGHKVQVKSEDEVLNGLALDVDGEGALVLRLEDGTIRRLVFGDVSQAG